MHRLHQDTRFAVRTLRKRPGFTVVAVMTLAIGIGANSAIFSVVNSVLFKGVAGLHDTAGLVEVSRDVNGDFFDFPYPIFQELRRSGDLVDDLAAMNIEPISLRVSADEDATVHAHMAVTGNYFTLLGLSPYRGRFFAPGESFFPRNGEGVVISHRLWLRRFDGDPDVASRTVLLNGVSQSIVGVAPPGFAGHAVGLQLELWTLLGADIPGMASRGALASAASSMIEVIGRLRDGATVEQARRHLTEVARRFNRAETGNDVEFVVRVEPWAPVPAIIRTGVLAFLSVLMVVVGLVLTMACVNVANMLLSRATERRTEIAIRLALGASRGRVMRQLLTESLILFVAAGAVAVVLTGVATRALLALQPPLPPGFLIELDLGLDWRVVGFAFLISVVAGVVFSLAPVFRATRPDVVPALKDDALSAAPVRSRIRQVMVAVQMAATLLVLIVAGLFLRALESMKSIDPGWSTENVVTLPLDMQLAGIEESEGQQFYRALTDRMAAIPGIESAALASKLPLAGRSSLGLVNVAGVNPPDGQNGHDASFNRVSPGYFATVGLQLLQGRDITNADDVGRPLVAVINRAMADRLWPATSPVGQRFYLGPVGAETSFEVVGVVESAKYHRLVEETPNFYYVPYQQRYNSQMIAHVRVTPGTEETVLPALRQTVRGLRPSLPIPVVRPLTEALDMFFLPQRLASWVAGVMGLVGLVLGAVGVYGVTAFAVGQRKREIGVRIAMGADHGDVTRLMLRQGMVGPGVGIVVGLALALAVSRVLSSFLGAVDAADPVTFVTVVGTLAAVAGVAVFVPARRAARLDPVTTLRVE